MKKNELLMLLVSFFILVLAWIAFSVYHHSVTSKIPREEQTAIIDISSTFDTKTINALKQRTIVEPLYTLGIQPLVTPTPQPTKKLTPSPQPPKTASSGGTLQ